MLLFINCQAKVEKKGTIVEWTREMYKNAFKCKYFKSWDTFNWPPDIILCQCVALISSRHNWTGWIGQGRDESLIIVQILLSSHLEPIIQTSPGISSHQAYCLWQTFPQRQDRAALLSERVVDLFSGHLMRSLFTQEGKQRGFNLLLD